MHATITAKQQRFLPEAQRSTLVNPNALVFTDPFGKIGEEANVSNAWCIQHHVKQTCIRSTEHRSFLAVDGNEALTFERAVASALRLIGVKRSASLVPDAVAPEANRTLYNERVNQTCSQGCGTERVDGTCNTLDFWGYREVNMWNCSAAYNDSGAVHNGRSGAPSFVWYLGGCVTPVDLDGASAWNGQGKPCGDRQDGYIA